MAWGQSFEVGSFKGSFKGPQRPSLPTCRGSWNFIFWSNLSYINSNYLPKDEDWKWLHKGMAWGQSFEVGSFKGSFKGPQRPSLPTCRESWNLIFWSNLSYINSNYLPKDQVSKWLYKGMAWGQSFEVETGFKYGGTFFPRNARI